MAAKQRGATAVEKKLVGVADVVITAAERRKDPTLAIPVRALSNINFNARNGMIEMGKRKQARSFFNVGMAKKFMQTVLWLMPSASSSGRTSRPRSERSTTEASTRSRTRTRTPWTPRTSPIRSLDRKSVV